MPPPSFSRFRPQRPHPPKRPRTTKSLQPKTFIPATSVHGLPQPINIAPDETFEFSIDHHVMDGGIGFHDTGSGMSAAPLMSASITIPLSSTNGVSIDGSVQVINTSTSTNGVPLTNADGVQLQLPPPRAIPITPKPQKRRPTGLLPQASRAPWLLYEDRLLTVLYKRYREDWETISAHFSDRSAIQVQRRWHDHLKVFRKWSSEEDNVVRKMQRKAPGQWDKVAGMLNGRSAASARYHWFYEIERACEYGFR